MFATAQPDMVGQNVVGRRKLLRLAMAGDGQLCVRAPSWQPKKLEKNLQNDPERRS